MSHMPHGTYTKWTLHPHGLLTLSHTAPLQSGLHIGRHIIYNTVGISLSDCPVFHYIGYVCLWKLSVIHIYYPRLLPVLVIGGVVEYEYDNGVRSAAH